MRKKLLVAAAITVFTLSACANRVEEGSGNMAAGTTSADTEMFTGGEGLTGTEISPDGNSPAVGTATSKDLESAESQAESGEQEKSITVVQEGCAGTLQVVLQEGWTYDACPEGSDQLRVGDYGIHFYPEDVSEGFIELCYVDFFGVCGTGLAQEKVTLAGDEANIGTYDYGDNWDFISFQGTNKGIVALTYAVEGWWPEYEEQVLEILDTVSLKRDHVEGASSDAGTFSGVGAETGSTQASSSLPGGRVTTIACGTNLEPSDNLEEDSCIEGLGLSLEVKEHTDTGATLVFRQSGGNPTGELDFGAPFIIEKYADGEWTEMPVVVKGDYGFNMVAYMIPMGEDREFQVEWEWLYGELEPGEYRIRKEVHDFRKSADYDEYEIYAYFEI